MNSNASTSGQTLRTAQTTIHIIAALLLLSAGLLKAFHAVTGPAETRSALAWLLQFGLIEFELAVAAMLLLNLFPAAARYLALTAFTVFATVSLRKAMAGSSSCGCFGPVDIDPRVTTAIDLLMVLLLALAGAPRAKPQTLTSTARRSLWRRITAIALAMSMIGAAGAIAYAAAPKRGIVVEGAAAVHDFGLVPPEQAKHCEHAFRVHNTASRPIRITGFQSSCGCTVAHLPTEPIPAGASADVHVVADWTGVVGQPYARVTLQTDSFWTREILLTIHAEIPATSAVLPK